MVDELNFLPEDTGGGIIEIVKQAALDNAAKIAKEALQAVDKTGVITSQLTEGDLIEIGTGIQEKDTDKIKNVIDFNLDKIQGSIPSALLATAGVNLAQPEMMAINIANNLVQTGGMFIKAASDTDIPGDNIFSKGAEGILDVANIVANNPQYGITPNLANIVGGTNRIYGDTIGRPLGWAGQKIRSYTNPIFKLLGSPFQTKRKADEVSTVDPLSFAASDPVADPVFTPPPATINEANVPYYTGDTRGSYGGGEDFGSPYKPTVTYKPTMADVAGPSSNTIEEFRGGPGGGGAGRKISRKEKRPTPRRRPTHHFAQGGLASMARVLRR